MSKAPYKPPIPWDRFYAMFVALYKRIYMAEQIDKATAEEIYDALRQLQAIYQDELRASFPNRRVKEQDLREAALAAALVDFHGVNPAEAMIAATGNPGNVERDSLARTFKNRRPKLVGDAYAFRSLDAVAAALTRVPRVLHDAHVQAYRKRREAEDRTVPYFGRTKRH